MIISTMQNERPRARDLADWALARGRGPFTSDDIAGILDVPREQVSRRLHPRVKKSEWVSPVQGLWVPVPAHYRLWGAPPGIEIVDGMMHHLEVEYYVGWLSAAALHGASHQAVQQFQVATDRPVRDRQVGRTRFSFHTRRSIPEGAARQHNTPTGRAWVSTVATTALDIATDPSIAAGIDNAATVLIELSEHPDFEAGAIASAAAHYPVASIRRLGWILETFSEAPAQDALHAISASGPSRPSRLNPSLAITSRVNARWNLSLNDDVEPDI